MEGNDRLAERENSERNMTEIWKEISRQRCTEEMITGENERKLQTDREIKQIKKETVRENDRQKYLQKATNRKKDRQANESQ